MTIKELIAELQQVLQDHGDLEVAAVEHEEHDLMLRVEDVVVAQTKALGELEYEKHYAKMLILLPTEF